MSDRQAHRTEQLLIEINEGRTYETVGPIAELCRQLECELADAKAEIARLTGCLADAESEMLEERQAYDDLVMLLVKRFPQRPDGSLPDYAVEDVLKENDTLKAEIARLSECVRAADEMLNSNPHAIFAWTIERYDAARKQVKI